MTLFLTGYKSHFFFSLRRITARLNRVSKAAPTFRPLIAFAHNLIVLAGS